MKIKRGYILLMVASLPVLLFLNSWQVFRYDSLLGRVSETREQQKAWIEESKELIVGIEFLSSPERISRLAVEELGLQKIGNDRILRINIKGEE